MTDEIKVGPLVVRLGEGIGADEYAEVVEWGPDALLEVELAGKLHLWS